MPEIDGKQVVFRDKLPAEQWWPLLSILALLSHADNPLDVLSWPTVCQMIAGSVESWEFEGDPGDPEAAGKLDTFAELIPLIKEISEMIGERQPSGKVAKGST